MASIAAATLIESVGLCCQAANAELVELRDELSRLTDVEKRLHDNKQQLEARVDQLQGSFTDMLGSCCLAGLRSRVATRRRCRSLVDAARQNMETTFRERSWLHPERA